MLDRFDVLRMVFDLASLHKSISLQYTMPWIGGYPIDLEGQLYHSSYEQPSFIGAQRNIYDIVQHGTLLSVKFFKNAYISEIHAGAELLQTSPGNAARHNSLRALARAINFQVCLFDAWISYVFIEPTLIIDRAVPTSNPHEGTFTFLSCKAMLPIAGRCDPGGYIRCTIEHTWYHHIRSAVVAFRTRLGHIFFRNFESIMPSERFYLGGSHSLRSYDTDLVPPLGSFIDDQGRKQVVPKGGKTMFNTMTEIRLTPFFLSKIGLVFFLDTGFLASNIAEILSPNWFYGLGLGFRYKTPIGPLRVDIGFTHDTHPLLPHQHAWFIVMGHAF